MCVGTLFTQSVVPSIYMLITRDHSKDRKLPVNHAMEDI